MRGPLAPPAVPVSLSRADAFDDLVRESIDRLRARWDQELDGVEFGIQDVPGPKDLASEEGPEVVPLARLDSGNEERASRIVVFRRPVELRAAGRAERAALVHDLVVEQVADLLGLAPETVDPQYGQG
jgi:hypothetical protein